MEPHDRQIQAYRNVSPSKEELWMATHEPVYQEFKRFAWEAILAGHSKIGAKACMERVRWESMLKKKKGDQYACNNSYVTAMAKRFIQENPQCEGVFNFREAK